MAHSRWSSVAVVVVLVAIAACGTAGSPRGEPGRRPAPPPTVGSLPRRITTPGGSPGVLLDPREGPKNRAGRWAAATEQDVAAFERALPGDLRHRRGWGVEEVRSRLRSYGRQYVAIRGSGRRLIEVHAFCTDVGSDGDGLIPPLHWLVVSDGGPCFWEATFDVASGRVLRLSVNGMA